MPITITFPRQEGLPDPGPISLDNCYGYRIATFFPTDAKETGIDRNFALQLLVIEPAANPSIPKMLSKDAGQDLSSLRGRNATVVLDIDPLTYTFNQITLVKPVFHAFATAKMHFHVGLFNFQFSTQPLRNTNKIDELIAVELTTKDSPVSGPAIAVASAGFEIEQEVRNAAAAAKNGAPDVVGFDLNRPVASADFVRDAGAQSGAVCFSTRRDSSMSWLNTMLVQNCAQSKSVDKEKPEDGVVGGKLVFHLNKRLLTGSSLVPNAVKGYFVEEVYGWFNLLPAMSGEEVCEMLPSDVAGLSSQLLDRWLLPTLPRLERHCDFSGSMPGEFTERVGIRFKHGLGLSADDYLFT